MEVRDDEVRVGDVEVERGRGEDDAGEAAEEEGDEEADGPQHRCLEGEGPLPHGPDPVEELHTRRHGDEEGHEREEGQQHAARHVHVVRPHRDGEPGDGDRGADEAHVAEDGLAREDREDLRDDAEERQRDDVDLGVAEEPEEVLPEQRPAVGRVEDVRAELAVRLQAQERGGEAGEGEDHEHRGEQHVPHEDRHAERGHAGSAHGDDRGDEVDGAEDRAEALEGEAHDPQVGAHARRVDGVVER